MGNLRQQKIQDCKSMPLTSVNINSKKRKKKIINQTNEIYEQLRRDHSSISNYTFEDSEKDITEEDDDKMSIMGRDDVKALDNDGIDVKP